MTQISKMPVGKLEQQSFHVLEEIELNQSLEHL